MAQVYPIEKIRKNLPNTATLLDRMQDAFVSFSKRQVTVADVSHIKFDSHKEHPGDACIKSGYVRGAEYFVVKIGLGFGNNQRMNPPISNSQGAMMVFSQKTGQLAAVLDDGGELTDIRTALAVCVCARAFAPTPVETIGFVGAGVIASLSALTMRKIFPDAKILVWSRTKASTEKFKAKMEAQGWKKVQVVDSASEIADCDIIVTATPSQTPVLEKCKTGALVIAVGADAQGKRELGPEVVRGACMVCDSKSQCLAFGEASHAVREGLVREDGIVELGVLLSGVALDTLLGVGEVNRKVDTRALGMDGKTIVVDLTGVAVQDVVIATLVLAELQNESKRPSVLSPSLKAEATPHLSQEPEHVALHVAAVCERNKNSSRDFFTK